MCIQDKYGLANGDLCDASNKCQSGNCVSKLDTDKVGTCARAATVFEPCANSVDAGTTTFFLKCEHGLTYDFGSGEIYGECIDLSTDDQTRLENGGPCQYSTQCASGVPGTTLSKTEWGIALDRNKLGIEKCYAPVGVYKDTYGTFEITEDTACYY